MDRILVKMFLVSLSLGMLSRNVKHVIYISRTRRDLFVTTEALFFSAWAASFGLVSQSKVEQCEFGYYPVVAGSFLEILHEKFNCAINTYKQWLLQRN